MKKNTYIKPAITMVDIQTESIILAASSVTGINGLKDGQGRGGQSDGSVEINAKNNKYDIWGLDEDEN